MLLFCPGMKKAALRQPSVKKFSKPNAVLEHALGDHGVSYLAEAGDVGAEH